jgi:diacylglycerol kinase (ATP)
MEHPQPGTTEIILNAAAMERKLIYLINPISGTKNKEQILASIRERTIAQHIPFEILHTNPTGNYQYLKEKILNEQITDVVICGGDGTVNQVAQALLGVVISIGIIPLGSGNGLAFTVKIPANINKALDIIFIGNASSIDAFSINGSFSCLLSGLGFDALVAHDFATHTKRGLATYIKKSFDHFFKVRPYSFEFINKEKAFSTEAYFISIANGNQFGNHVTIAPKASLGDGLLDIIIVKKMNKFRMVLLVVRQTWTGKVMEYEEKKFHASKVFYFQTDKLVINNPSLAPLHIDGEPAETAAKLEIEIIPRAFKLIQPL